MKKQRNTSGISMYQLFNDCNFTGVIQTEQLNSIYSIRFMQYKPNFLFLAIFRPFTASIINEYKN